MPTKRLGVINHAGRTTKCARRFSGVPSIGVSERESVLTCRTSNEQSGNQTSRLFGYEIVQRIKQLQESGSNSQPFDFTRVRAVIEVGRTDKRNRRVYEGVCLNCLEDRIENRWDYLWPLVWQGQPLP